MNSDNIICFDSEDENVYSDDENCGTDINICKSTPWIEKYRPKTLDSIIYQDEVIKVLRNTIRTGNLPHLLLYGPAGTGKTSTILAVARELFGPFSVQDRVLELNASDERGINIVRKKIITFAKLKISNADNNYPSPNYKIIILDEADAMTKEAQSALRKVMEEYSSITRFCFICNYINQIIEPINSRCVKFRFRQLNDENMHIKLKEISVSEKILVNDDDLNIIVSSSDGDMRKAIMLLQNLKYIDFQTGGDEITNMIGILPSKIINKIISTCITNSQSNQLEVINLAKKIIKRGFPISNIISAINTIIIESDILSDVQKANITTSILKCENRVSQGSDEYIQLLNIFMKIKKYVLGL